MNKVHSRKSLANLHSLDRLALVRTCQQTGGTLAVAQKEGRKEVTALSQVTKGKCLNRLQRSNANTIIGIIETVNKQKTVVTLTLLSRMYIL